MFLTVSTKPVLSVVFLTSGRHVPVGDTKESYSFLVQIKVGFDAIMLKFLAINEKRRQKSEQSKYHVMSEPPISSDWLRYKSARDSIPGTSDNSLGQFFFHLCDVSKRLLQHEPKKRIWKKLVQIDLVTLRVFQKLVKLRFRYLGSLNFFFEVLLPFLVPSTQALFATCITKEVLRLTD